MENFLQHWEFECCITYRRDETDDLGTSTFASAWSGASLKEARIPALSICSSNSWVSDTSAESLIIQEGAVPMALRFALNGSLMEAVWSTCLPWENDLELTRRDKTYDKWATKSASAIGVWSLIETWHVEQINLTYGRYCKWAIWAVRRRECMPREELNKEAWLLQAPVTSGWKSSYLRRVY